MPLARGGTDDDTNRVCCCFRCNQAKGALTEAEFRSMSTVDAIRFNDAVKMHGLGNMTIIEVAMAAGRQAAA